MLRFFKAPAKNVRLIVAAPGLKGRRGEGHYNNTTAPKNLPIAANKAQETRVCRSEKLHGTQCRCPDSPAVLWSHFPSIFCVHGPCQSHGGQACCAGRLEVIPTRLLQRDCSTGVERRPVISL